MAAVAATTLHLGLKHALIAGSCRYKQVYGSARGFSMESKEVKIQGARADTVERLDLILADTHRHDVAHPVAGTQRRIGSHVAKSGFLILCVSGDPAFAMRAARTAEADNAHTAISWSAEDLERLPMWGFHGAVCDRAEAERIALNASPRVKARLAGVPTVIATDGPESAVKNLLLLLVTAAQQTANSPL